jgi:hypothetical protein
MINLVVRDQHVEPMDDPLYDLGTLEHSKSIDAPNFASKIPYEFSEIDEGDKHTEDCWQCIAFVATGTSKETGKKISFMLHVGPNALKEQHRTQFINKFGSYLEKFKQKTVEAERTAIVTGGFAYVEGNEESKKKTQKNRSDLVELIKMETATNLCVSPQEVVTNDVDMSRVTHIYHRTHENIATVLFTSSSKAETPLETKRKQAA